MTKTNPMPSAPSTSQQIATIETQADTIASIPTVTCDFASDVSTSEAAECEQNNTHLDKDTLKVSTITSATLPSSPTSFATNGKGGGQSSSPKSGDLKVSPTAGRCRAHSVGIDTDMVSEFDPSSSDSGVISRCAVVKPTKFRLCQPIFGKKSGGLQKCNSSASDSKLPKHVELAELEPAIPKIQKPRDPEKEKRRIARKKEKRATLILGLIMGSFIASWLPFFFLYILKPACPRCNIPPIAFSVAFWLGYMNSALNPVIYTIFNKDFRRAFRRILFK